MKKIVPGTPCATSTPLTGMRFCVTALFACLLLLPAPALAGNTFTYSGTTTGNLYGNDNGTASTDNPSARTSTPGTGSNNNVTIGSGASMTGGMPYLVGGHESGAGANANNNTVTINGAGLGATAVHGGYAKEGNAQGNKIYITSGAILNNTFGGFASGSASGNELHMSGGTVEALFGGMSYGGAIENNHIYVSGGTVTGCIQTSYMSDGRNNSVTISNPFGTLDLSTAQLVGQDSDTNWQTHGNTLNLKSSGISVAGLRYFQNYNF